MQMISILKEEVIDLFVMGFSDVSALMLFGITLFCHPRLGEATVPVLWLQPWRLFGIAFVFAELRLILTIYVIHGLQTPVFWRGSHSYTVVAAIDSVLCGSHISGSEPEKFVERRRLSIEVIISLLANLSRYLLDLFIEVPEMPRDAESNNSSSLQSHDHSGYLQMVA
ncbi:hypothetical protein Tco_1426108 [Tanacetum coccineum]